MPAKPEAPRSRDIIRIERRVTVAEILTDGSGEHPPLRAAFMAASDAIADYMTDSDTRDRIEFAYAGHTFAITATPVERER